MTDDSGSRQWNSLQWLASGKLKSKRGFAKSLGKLGSQSANIGIYSESPMVDTDLEVALDTAVKPLGLC